MCWASIKCSLSFSRIIFRGYMSPNVRFLLKYVMFIGKRWPKYTWTISKYTCRKYINFKHSYTSKQIRLFPFNHNISGPFSSKPNPPPLIKTKKAFLLSWGGKKLLIKISNSSITQGKRCDIVQCCFPKGSKVYKLTDFQIGKQSFDGRSS